MDVQCCTASILHLVAIAIDRHSAVTSVDYIRKRQTARPILIMIATVWCSSLAISVPTRFYPGRNQTLERIAVLVEGRCDINPGKWFTIFSTGGAFFIPMCFLIGVYLRIYQAATNRIRNKRNIGQVNLTNQTASSVGKSNSVVNQEHAFADMHNHITHIKGKRQTFYKTILKLRMFGGKSKFVVLPNDQEIHSGKTQNIINILPTQIENAPSSTENPCRPEANSTDSKAYHSLVEAIRQAYSSANKNKIVNSPVNYGTGQEIQRIRTTIELAAQGISHLKEDKTPSTFANDKAIESKYSTPDKNSGDFKDVALVNFAQPEGIKGSSKMQSQCEIFPIVNPSTHSSISTYFNENSAKNNYLAKNVSEHFVPKADTENVSKIEESRLIFNKSLVDTNKVSSANQNQLDENKISTESQKVICKISQQHDMSILCNDINGASCVNANGEMMCNSESNLSHTHSLATVNKKDSGKISRRGSLLQSNTRINSQSTRSRRRQKYLEKAEKLRRRQLFYPPYLSSSSSTLTSSSASSPRAESLKSGSSEHKYNLRCGEIEFKSEFVNFNNNCATNQINNIKNDKNSKITETNSNRNTDNNNSKYNNNNNHHHYNNDDDAHKDTCNRKKNANIVRDDTRTELRECNFPTANNRVSDQLAAHLPNICPSKLENNSSKMHISDLATRPALAANVFEDLSSPPVKIGTCTHYSSYCPQLKTKNATRPQLGDYDCRNEQYDSMHINCISDKAVRHRAVCHSPNRNEYCQQIQCKHKPNLTRYRQHSNDAETLAVSVGSHKITAAQGHNLQCSVMTNMVEQNKKCHFGRTIINNSNAGDSTENVKCAFVSEHRQTDCGLKNIRSHSKQSRFELHGPQSPYVYLKNKRDKKYETSRGFEDEVDGKIPPNDLKLTVLTCRLDSDAFGLSKKSALEQSFSVETTDKSQRNLETFLSSSALSSSVSSSLSLTSSSSSVSSSLSSLEVSISSRASNKSSPIFRRSKHGKTKAKKHYSSDKRYFVSSIAQFTPRIASDYTKMKSPTPRLSGSRRSALKSFNRAPIEASTHHIRQYPVSPLLISISNLFGFSANQEYMTPNNNTSCSDSKRRIRSNCCESIMELENNNHDDKVKAKGMTAVDESSLCFNAISSTNTLNLGSSLTDSQRTLALPPPLDRVWIPEDQVSQLLEQFDQDTDENNYSAVENSFTDDDENDNNRTNAGGNLNYEQTTDPLLQSENISQRLPLSAKPSTAASTDKHKITNASRSHHGSSESVKQLIGSTAKHNLELSYESQTPLHSYVKSSIRGLSENQELDRQSVLTVIQTSPPQILCDQKANLSPNDKRTQVMGITLTDSPSTCYLSKKAVPSEQHINSKQAYATTPDETHRSCKRMLSTNFPAINSSKQNGPLSSNTTVKQPIDVANISNINDLGTVLAMNVQEKRILANNSIVELCSAENGTVRQSFKRKVDNDENVSTREVGIIAKSVQQSTKTEVNSASSLKTLTSSKSDVEPVEQNQQAQNSLGPLQATTHRERMEHMRERRAARTLAIITGCFILCWLPFSVHALIVPFCDFKCVAPQLVESLFLWLGYMNSLLNPVIYTIFSPDFRNAFRKILFGRYHTAGKKSRF